MSKCETCSQNTKTENKEIKSKEIKKGVPMPTIDIEKAKEDYGIALVIIQSTEPTDKNLIAELVSEDDTIITIKNLAMIMMKPHFDDIVTLSGINPLFTVVPEGYADSRIDLKFLDKSGIEALIKKEDIANYRVVTDSVLIQQYVKGVV